MVVSMVVRLPASRSSHRKRYGGGVEGEREGEWERGEKSDFVIYKSWNSYPRVV